MRFFEKEKQSTMKPTSILQTPHQSLKKLFKKKRSKETPVKQVIILSITKLKRSKKTPMKQDILLITKLVTCTATAALLESQAVCVRFQLPNSYLVKPFARYPAVANLPEKFWEAYIMAWQFKTCLYENNIMNDKRSLRGSMSLLEFFQLIAGLHWLLVILKIKIA